VLDKTTSESRGCRICSLQTPNGESPIVLGNSRFGTSVVCSSGSVFTIGLNCAVRTLHSAGMDHDPTQEMIVEICGLLDSNAGLVNGPR
jgi:hypothetical protein